MGRVLLCLVCVALFATAAVAEPGVNGSWIGTVGEQTVPVVLPADGLWYYSAADAVTVGPDGLGGWMFIPAQADLWQVTGPGCFSITDAWISGDQFEVYANGVLILVTPAVPPAAPPVHNPDVPGLPIPFVQQATVQLAFNAPNYSSGFVLIPPGVHLINVKDISFPPGTSGAGFGVRFDYYCSPVEPKSWSGIKEMFR